MAEAPNAVRGLAEDATSRKRCLRQAGGGGVAASLVVFIAACGGDSKSSSKAAATSTPTMSAKSGTEQFGQGDLGIANYALTLEYLETDFYAKVNNSGMLKGKAAELARQEMATESGRLTVAPRTTFPLEDEKSILKLAATVENLGARAYLGQAGHIQDKEILAAALSIHSVEARHASVLNLATGAAPAPDAFAEPVTADEVLKTVKPFLAT